MKTILILFLTKVIAFSAFADDNTVGILPNCNGLPKINHDINVCVEDLDVNYYISATARNADEYCKAKFGKSSSLIDFDFEKIEVAKSQSLSIIDDAFAVDISPLMIYTSYRIYAEGRKVFILSKVNCSEPKK